jgi:hypothetical protein
MINSRMAALLALAGGVALGAALTLRLRRQDLHAEKRQHKQDVKAWEGEGGNHAS